MNQLLELVANCPEWSPTSGQVVSPVSPTQAPVDRWPEPPDDAAFHGVAGDFVRLVVPETEADPMAILIQFLIAIGNVIGRTVYWEVGGTRHFLNLFCVLCGDTSKGRKGTSLDLVLSVLKDIDPQWRDSRILSGLSSGEGLKYQMRDPIKEQEPILDKKIIKGYQSVITDPGIEDKRLLCTEPEFVNVLHMNRRNGNTLSAVIRQLWDSGHVRTLTKNDSITVTGGHCSIIAHITREELLRYFNKTDMANGFANRFLWFAVRRSQILPRGGNIRKLDFLPFVERIKRIVLFAESHSDEPMDMSEETWEMWDNVYPDLSREIPGLLGSILSRAEAQVRRLACLYALLDLCPIVKPEHLEAALALWEYCERSAAFIFGGQLGNRTADEILRALKTKPEGMSKTEISNHFNRNKQAYELDAAIDILTRQGLVCHEVIGSGKHSKEIWKATN